MERVVYHEVAGESYPLCLTTKALKTIYEEFGDVSDLEGMIEGKSPLEQLDIAIWLLELLMEQGAAYVRLVGKKETPKPLTMEELSILVSIEEIEPTVTKVYTAINIGMKSKIQVESQKKTMRDFLRRK